MWKKTLHQLKIDQDGWVGGHGTHLPPQTHQKYIHMWNSSYWKLTGNCQKEPYTTKDEIKTHKESARKERQEWDQDLCLRERTQRKREITWVEILPDEWTVQATYWVCQSWGLTQGRWAPLSGWRAHGTNRRAVGSLNSTHEEYVHALAGSQSRAERVDWKLLEWLPSFPGPPSLSWANTPALLTLHCSSTLEQELPWLRTDLGSEMQMGLRPEEATEQSGGSHYWHLHRQYIRSSPDLWGCQTAKACTATHAESPQVSHLPMVQLHTKEGAAEAEGKDWLWGTKETQTQNGIWELQCSHYWHLNR